MFLKSNAQSQARDLIISYKRVFGSVEGKRVLMDLMNRFHILNPTNGDTQEGERRAVLHILKQCNVNLKQLDELLKGTNPESESVT